MFKGLMGCSLSEILENRKHQEAVSFRKAIFNLTMGEMRKKTHHLEKLNPKAYLPTDSSEAQNSGPPSLKAKKRKMTLKLTPPLASSSPRRYLAWTLASSSPRRHPAWTLVNSVCYLLIIFVFLRFVFFCVWVCCLHVCVCT